MDKKGIPLYQKKAISKKLPFSYKDYQKNYFLRPNFLIIAL